MINELPYDGCRGRMFFFESNAADFSSGTGDCRFGAGLRGGGKAAWHSWRSTIVCGTLFGGLCC
jgi:hypothetical protein